MSQLTCLHDLLWFFVTSLTPPPMEVEEEEAANDEGKKEKKDPEPVSLSIGKRGCFLKVCY